MFGRGLGRGSILQQSSSTIGKVVAKDGINDRIGYLNRPTSCSSNFTSRGCSVCQERWWKFRVTGRQRTPTSSCFAVDVLRQQGLNCNGQPNPTIRHRLSTFGMLLKMPKRDRLQRCNNLQQFSRT